MAVLSPPKPSTDEERTPRRIAFRQQRGKWDVKLSPYLYISPFFVLFAITGLFPLVYTAWVSIHDWNLLIGQGEMVGLKNYADVLQQPNFWKALRNTNTGTRHIILFADAADAEQPGDGPGADYKSLLEEVVKEGGTCFLIFKNA